MTKNELYKIRPAGRHLFTIGKDLIKDPQAAIIELVKNAYDADSSYVEISFEVSEERDRIFIKIKDSGHGMTKNDVLKKWLVPSTNNKLNNPVSPKGRRMQGKKGVGRYAVSLLGSDLLMKTIDEQGNQAEIYIDWKSFRECDYLDQVDVMVDFSKTSENSGTELQTTGDREQVEYWTEISGAKEWTNINKLIKELKKMLSPNKDLKDTFDIILKIKNFDLNEDKTIVIEPYPILDIYDYRIFGKFSKDGNGIFKYQNCKISTNQEEDILLKEDVKCGEVEFDIKVYDRDTLKDLIERGLKNENGSYLNVNEAKSILNEASGIGVYRNGFRIRPLGDPGFDWLHLDTQRVQNPAFIIGNNQVIGIINIESEEKSGLEEKSARDGLKENPAYQNLIDITNVVLNNLERRRFEYRRFVDKQNKGNLNQLETLMDNTDTEEEIAQVLEEENVPVETTKKVLRVISKKQKEKEKTYKDITERIAMYEGQATLGKIINVVLHEARKPLNFFSTQIKNTEYWMGELIKNPSSENFNIISDILSDYRLNSKILSNLFKKLDPLSSTKRGLKEDINVYKIIKQALSVFENKIQELSINVVIECNPDIIFYAWEHDLSGILTNLIENSIYWIETNKPQDKFIKVLVDKKDFGFIMDIYDSGAEIPESAITSGAIFEPGYTSKPNGSGLGLALAGEAACRNNLILKAITHKSGAHFSLETKEKIND